MLQSLMGKKEHRSAMLKSLTHLQEFVAVGEGLGFELMPKWYTVDIRTDQKYLYRSKVVIQQKHFSGGMIMAIH